MNDTQTPLADLVTSVPGASRVFVRYGLDFCCQGARPLAEACADQGLDPAAILAEVQEEARGDDPAARWDLAQTAHLIAHIVDRYHAAHRRDLPGLLRLAERVEAVHAEKPDVPRGLAAHLRNVIAAVDSHLEKEEHILFPMLRAGQGEYALQPIRILTEEHDDHAAALRRSRELAYDFVAPPHACASWRALYEGLARFERELMEHVHLENHVLFPRAFSRGAR